MQRCKARSCWLLPALHLAIRAACVGSWLVGEPETMVPQQAQSGWLVTPWNTQPRAGNGRSGAYAVQSRY